MQFVHDVFLVLHKKLSGFNQLSQSIRDEAQIATTRAKVAKELLQATLEQERKYKVHITRLNSKVISALTTDLSQERKEVRELRRVVAITEDGGQLTKQEAQTE